MLARGHVPELSTGNKVSVIESAPARHLGLKIAVFALLAGNAAYYLYAGTLSQALDTTAWLILLALFSLETGLAERFRAHGMAVAIRGTRLVAAAAICAAAAGYVNQGKWLDAVNTGLWIAVVALLEFEVRWPRAVAQYRVYMVAAAVTLYGSLAVLVPVWAWRGEWFDAYDALLWLAAFAMIELDVLRNSSKHDTG